MGSSNSTELDKSLIENKEEHAQNRNYSRAYGITEWDTLPPKNYLYYSNKRFFKVPNNFYEDQAKNNWEFWFWVW